MNAKVANEIKLKVESLNTLHIGNLPMDANTTAWVAGIGDEWAAKLAAGGLIPEGQSFRTVPLFPELRQHLDGAFELAEGGAVYVVGGPTGDGFRAAADRPGGWMNANMPTTVLK
jgi:hypothetical protein